MARRSLHQVEILRRPLFGGLKSLTLCVMASSRSGAQEAAVRSLYEREQKVQVHRVDELYFNVEQAGGPYLPLSDVLEVLVDNRPGCDCVVGSRTWHRRHRR